MVAATVCQLGFTKHVGAYEADERLGGFLHEGAVVSTAADVQGVVHGDECPSLQRFRCKTGVCSVFPGYTFQRNDLIRWKPRDSREPL